MRIECPKGCNALLDVQLAQPPDEFISQTARSADMAPGRRRGVAGQEIARIRDEADRRLGHAISSAIVIHVLHGCPAATAAPADCGSLSPMGYTCSYADPDHDGDHEHRVADIDATGQPVTHIIANWPKQQALP